MVSSVGHCKQSNARMAESFGLTISTEVRPETRTPMSLHLIDTINDGSIVEPKRSLEALRSLKNIIDPKDIVFTKGDSLGSGAFGFVRKAVYKKDGTEIDCAVKIIDTVKEIESFRNEVHQLSRVKHENIVTVYGFCIDPYYLVMEYAAGGSLYRVLHIDPLSRNIHYTLAHALSWCLQCIRGVEYLHKMEPKPLIHRDLKPPNLLLIDEMLTLKICDFGTVCDLRTNMTNNKGSAAWMAPEVFQGSKYTEKCDIFSWGVIFWEVLSRQTPFKNMQNAFQIMWAISDGCRPPLLNNIPKKFGDLYQQCWDHDPDKRPTASEVVQTMEMLLSYCDPADLKPLRHRVFREESSSCSTVSSEDRCFSHGETPIATQLPNILQPNHFTDLRDVNRTLDLDEPSTSSHSTLDSKQSPALPRHRRQLSADLSALVGAKTLQESPRKTSLPSLSDGSQPVRKDQSYLLIDPRLQPFPSLSDSVESSAIYEHHKEKGQLYYRQNLEVGLLLRRNQELNQQLLQASETKSPVQLIYERLFNEHNHLVQMEETWRKQIETHSNRHGDDDWVIVP